MTKTQTENEFGVEVGDVFYTSWGYDQTNYDFYKVVEVTRRKARIVPIGSQHITTQGQQNVIVPDPDVERDWDVLIGIHREDEDKSKLCTVKPGYQGRVTIVLNSRDHHYAWPHEGRSYAETDSRFGH